MTLDLKAPPRLDLAATRAHFPAFDAPALEGRTHFDNAGGSYACEEVIERLRRFYVETKVQPYGAAQPSARGGAEMDAAYERYADALNVGRDEIVFTPSTTASVYALAHAFADRMSPGAEIIVTDQDHEANIGAWRKLEARGFVLREWSADPETGALDPADLDALLTDRTAIVAFTHCSNIVAQPNPVAEICAKIRAAGARSVVDGVSSAPHGLPDVEALGADVYLFSLYKVYGPHLGVMTVRRPTMAVLGNQSHGFNDADPRKRLNPAGPDHAQIAAASGVIDYLDALHDMHFPPAPPAERARRTRRLMQAAETELLFPLLAALNLMPEMRVLGPKAAADRAPTIALDTERPPAELSEALARRGIIAGASDFYAPRILRRMGVDPARGVLRLSFTHYASRDEIDALIEALDAVRAER